MLYVLVIPLAFFGDPRFHYPAMPLAVVIAAATVVRLWDARRSASAGQSVRSGETGTPSVRADGAA
jgi:hypothetical protein